MCGIAGFWEWEKRSITEGQFRAFVGTLAHRGPDGQGIYQDVEEPLFLGHQRLSILDVSDNGTQPMSFGNGRFWSTFNGEIYNFLELRRELEALGHLFVSNSDTEVLLASYVEWREQCQLKFNGMWAFAIWDAQKKELFLSRDRFGVKPLYIAQGNGYFAFASELKAFLLLPGFQVVIDQQVITDLLMDENCLESTEDSWMRGVKRLQAGRSLTCQKGGNISICRWWNTLDHLPVVPQTWEGQIEQFRALFFDACRIRSRSDVPTATALSGGLDSSAVLATMAYLRSGAVEERMPAEWRYVFSALFPGTSQNEAEFIQQMVECTKTISFSCDILPRTMVEYFDQVLYDCENIIDLPIGPWVLYREFRKHRAVISIDGHGADELLGGYVHHVDKCMQASFFTGTSFEYERILQKMYPEGSPWRGASRSSVLKRGLKEWLAQRSPGAYHALKKRFGPAHGKEWLHLEPRRKRYGEEFQRDLRWKKLGFLNRMLYIDFHEKTLPTILRNFDRCSMAHGVEIRAPFLDWRLVTYAFSLPESAKIGGGVTKRILREAMKGKLPEPILKRSSKVGFANPIIEWLRQDLRSFLLDHIGSNSFQNCPLWKGAEIFQFVEQEYKKGNQVQLRAIWGYLQAHRLMQLFTRKHAYSHG